jgi:glucose dehydrogenase
VRTFCTALASAILALPACPQAAPRKGDWPAYGRDPGGTRYSPLDQINTKNVGRLQRAWVYHTRERGRAFEVTPLIVDDVLYLATQNQKIVALEPETGKEIWKYDPRSNGREFRGVAYWPGEKQAGDEVDVPANLYAACSGALRLRESGVDGLVRPPSRSL